MKSQLLPFTTKAFVDRQGISHNTNDDFLCQAAQILGITVQQNTMKTWDFQTVMCVFSLDIVGFSLPWKRRNSCYCKGKASSKAF